jgi:RNA polymerase sigma factor (sigma-70 family)
VSEQPINPAGVPTSGELHAAEAESRGMRRLLENRSEFLRFVVRRVRRVDVAEDILQEAYARSFSNLPALRDEDAVVGWFFKILRNALVDHARRLEVSNRATANLALEPDTSDGPHEVANNPCHCVARVSDGLKPEYVTALARVTMDGIPVVAFAEEQGISPGNAAVRVFRAREALKKQVMACCGACAESGCVDCTCAREK